eukprot:512268_1
MATKSSKTFCRYLKYNLSIQHSLHYNSIILKRTYTSKISSKRFQNLHHNLRQLIEPRYVVHFGNLLAVCAMMQSEMLYLRSFMIGASVCGIAFNLLQPIPLITPACWGIFFIFGHSIQIYFLIRDKLSITMSADLNQVYEEAFFTYGFTPRQFIDLCQYANYSFITYKTGDNITVEGSDMPYLNWLLNGKVRVKTNNFGVLTILDTNDDKLETKWLGEFFDPNRDVSYWDKGKKHKWVVTYECLTDCKCIQLDRKKLDIFLNQNDSFKEKASKIVVKDVWGKLRHIRDGKTQPDLMHSYGEMLNIALLNDNAQISEKVKSYLEKYATNNNIDKSYIDTFLSEHHGLSYDELFENN